MKITSISGGIEESQSWLLIIVVYHEHIKTHVHILTDLDAIKTNDIRLFLLENDLTHLIFHFEVQFINFSKGADFASYRPPSFDKWLGYRCPSQILQISTNLYNCWHVIFCQNQFEMLWDRKMKLDCLSKQAFHFIFLRKKSMSSNRLAHLEFVWSFKPCFILLFGNEIYPLSISSWFYENIKSIPVNSCQF